MSILLWHFFELFRLIYLCKNIAIESHRISHRISHRRCTRWHYIIILINIVLVFRDRWISSSNSLSRCQLNQHTNTRAILDFLTNDKLATLQAENSDLKRAASQDRQSALLTTAMASQTQQLINAINPAPIPAYQVPNPNTFYGCGCNTGCNCW